MQIHGVLATDGGPHSPEKWAMATARVVFNTDNVLSDDRAMLAAKVQLDIAEALLHHHAAVQGHEDRKLALQGDDRVDRDQNIDRANETRVAEDIYADVQKALKGTPWEQHYAREDVAAQAKLEIASHMMTVRDIGRQWYKARKES